MTQRTYAEFHDVLSNQQKLVFFLPLTIVFIIAMLFFALMQKEIVLDVILSFCVAMTIPAFLYFVPYPKNTMLKIALVVITSISGQLLVFYFNNTESVKKIMDYSIPFTIFLGFVFLLYQIKFNMSFGAYIKLFKRYGLKAAFNIGSKSLSKYIVEKEEKENIEFIKLKIQINNILIENFKSEYVQNIPRIFFSDYLVYLEKKSMVIVVQKDKFSKKLSLKEIDHIIQDIYFVQLMQNAMNAYLNNQQYTVHSNRYITEVKANLREKELYGAISAVSKGSEKDNHSRKKI